MYSKRSKKTAFVASMLVLSIFAGLGIASNVSTATEKGVIRVFKSSKSKLNKTQDLWENQSFDLRQMEYLDRGLIAVKTGDGVFVSWRWLGTESNTTKYNLYRDGERINAFPLNITNYTDTGGTLESKYQVAAVVDGVEQERCEEISAWEDNKLEIQFDDIPEAVKPDGSPKLNEDGSPVIYEPTETSIADLDGDGVYEIILKWDPSDRCDNSIHGITSPLIIDAYKLDGTKMWRINLGYNIRTGSHYTQLMVYDLDGDGKAEVVCKTADGTTDNAGTVIGDKSKLWRNEQGRILEGPEYLTVFDGETGTIVDTVDYVPGRGNPDDWGDNYGNRVDRFLATVAYVEGKTPSVVMCRGYYTRSALTAWNLVDRKLKMVWAFDTDNGYSKYMGQGNHSVCAADVDLDGKDEIIYGAMIVDDDGTPDYSTGLGHGDAQHTGDLIPDRPGLEIFSVHEHTDSRFGVEMRDARTGEILWGSWEAADIGRGVSGDIDPNWPGSESWAADKMVASTGELICTKPVISQNFLIYWDGDLGREVQDSNHIDKWVPETNRTKILFLPKGYVSNNGTKATPGITCDLFGDWREETILFKDDRSSMAIFTTTDPTDYKVYTLMHDPQYRTYISTQNVAYNQPPHTGYYLGYETEQIPASRVEVNHDGKTYTNPDLRDGIKYYPIESLKRDEGVAMVVGNSLANVNGRMERIDSENKEIVPHIKNERTLVPIRFIAEAFGADVDWNEAKREVTIKLGNDTIKMKINQASYTINGKTHELDTAAAISQGRTFVPLRAVAEAFGKKVAWDGRGIIYINDTTETIDETSGSIILKNIEEYIEPEAVSTEPERIDGAQMNDKQISVYGVESSSDDGNIAQGAVDGNFTTRWNAFGEGETLVIDFNEVKDVAAVAASFFKGNERKYYFDIAVSEDGKTWTTVLEKQESSGNTANIEELEMFKFKETVKARYVKYIGHGSSSNDSNNMYEFIAIAP